MAEKTFRRIRDWVEPAHPSIVRLHEDLVAILRYIRDKFQVEIDRAFDRASEQIGFVVTTSLPVKLELAEGGKVKDLSLGAKHLQGTIFEKEVMGVLKRAMEGPIPVQSGSKGTFQFYVVWLEALKLKIRMDWLEPVHILKGGIWKYTRPEVVIKEEWIGPGIEEPAHWFDPGSLISEPEGVLIDALDEVYPELRLVERISHYRQGLGRVMGPHPDPWRANLLEKVKTHLEVGGEAMAKEIAEVLSRYGCKM